MLKIMLIIFAVIMLTWFAATALMGIVNLGNICGIFIFSVFLICLLFPLQLRKNLAIISSTPPGKAVLTVIAAVVIVAVLWCVILSVLMVRSATKTNDESEVIIVLGCKVNSSGPSRMLKNRLDTAYEFLQQNPNVICVVSGGKGADEPRAEGDVMRDYLVAKGIAGERIIVENSSKNTYENLQFSFAILEEKGLPDSRVSLVTDAFHQCRAQHIAKKLGREVYAVSANTELVFLPTYWVREWLGLTKELIFG